MNSLIFGARGFARQAHMAQARHCTGEPYFVHLEEVANRVERAGLSDEAIAAAWLHDVSWKIRVSASRRSSGDSARLPRHWLKP